MQEIFNFIENCNARLAPAREQVAAHLQSLRGTLSSFVLPGRPLCLRLANCAATNGDELLLPADLLYAKHENRLLILGLLVHELSHYYYTNFEAVNTLCNTRMWGEKYLERAGRESGLNPETLDFGELVRGVAEILNAIEDPRVERLIAGNFGSAGLLLEYTHQRTDQVSNPELARQSLSAGRILSRLCAHIHARMSAALTPYRGVNYAGYIAITTAVLTDTFGKRVVASVDRALQRLAGRLTENLRDEKAIFTEVRKILNQCAAGLARDLLPRPHTGTRYRPKRRTDVPLPPLADPQPLGVQLQQELLEQGFLRRGISGLLRLVREHSVFAKEDLQDLNCSLIDKNLIHAAQPQLQHLSRSLRFFAENERSVMKFERDDWGHGPLFSPERWAELTTSSRPQILSLGLRLHRELTGFAKRRSSCLCRSGTRVHRSVVPRLDAGIFVPRPFATPGEREALSTEIALLVDLSGSMFEPGKCDGLSRALILLCGALGPHLNDELRLAIYAYSDNYKLVKRPDEPLTAEILHRIPAIYLNNNDYPVMVRAAMDLTQSPCERRIIIAITDGYWDYPSRFGFRHREGYADYDFLQELNIETYGLMVGDADFENTPDFTAAFFAKDPRQMPEVLSDLLVRALRRSRQLRQKNH